MSYHERILGIFAKWPAPGMVKTRLAAATTAAFAAEVAAAFLHDVLDRWRDYPARRILALSPFAVAGNCQLGEPHWSVQPQAAGGLGARLSHFFRTCHAEYPDAHVVVLGTDSPTVPDEYLDQAFASLADADVVLGPATDGGYYLIGGGTALPHELFAGIEYGHVNVLQQTVARLPDTARCSILSPWYDVDTIDDWQMLRGHLAALRAAGIDPQTPRTEQLTRRPEIRPGHGW